MIMNCMKTLVLASFMLCAFESTTCSKPKAGYGLNVDELIEQSDNIFLVELVNLEKSEYQSTYTLEVVDVIKGAEQTKLTFTGYAEKHTAEHFNNHENEVFWSEASGRSGWPCCICGPNHTFEQGFIYLYFPDLLGAKKSAEIINNKDDKWLRYVIEKVGN